MGVHVCAVNTEIWDKLEGLSSENDIEGYFIEKSVLISKISLQIL